VNISEFSDVVAVQGPTLYRDMPWRQPDLGGTFDPYKILVSEVMLQQTQVARVIPKYTAFLQQFASAADLASAPLAAVLTAWSGLGYNRRALWLQQSAKQLQHKSVWTYIDLIACKGIGPNTVNAVLAYTYNQPVVFIETNIRTVFIHYFFTSHRDVTDKQVIELLKSTMPSNVRQWYWALMDMGSAIKAHHGNKANQSKSYKKQSAFAGSVRQTRGQILRALQPGPMTAHKLAGVINDQRLAAILDTLTAEMLVSQQADKYFLGQKTPKA
jgi:A/G-specific adenine glycosylase